MWKFTKILAAVVVILVVISYLAVLDAYRGFSHSQPHFTNRTVVPADLEGTWSLSCQNGSVMDVVLNRDGSYVQHILTAGVVTLSNSGKWRIKEHEVDFDDFLSWEGGVWVKDLGGWFIEDDPNGTGGLALLGDESPDPDGYRLIFRTPVPSARTQRPQSTVHTE